MLLLEGKKRGSGTMHSQIDSEEISETMMKTTRIIMMKLIKLTVL